MNPLEEYIAIIHHRQLNPLPKSQYSEKHHIIPQSLGGPNRKWNRVRLTPEEHYMAHYWLTFIYATGEAHDSMMYAWNWLSNRIRGEFVSAEEYGRLKREYAALVGSKIRERTPWNKGIHTGKVPWNKGTKGVMVAWNKGKKGFMSQAGRQSLSEANKGNTKHLGKNHSDETRKKISEAKAGKPSPKKGKPGVPKTEEQKQRQREAMLRYWSAKKLTYGKETLPPTPTNN